MKMSFPDNRHTGRTIDVEIDCNGNGQAYFRADDMLADVRRGDFQHPYSGTKYRVIMPYKAQQSATLQVQAWRDVGNALPSEK